MGIDTNWTLRITVEDYQTGEVTEFDPSEHDISDAHALMMLAQHASYVIAGRTFHVRQPIIDFTNRIITLRGEC